ncbi:hypothetical protein BGZ92_001177 [Podila epicladia]|nr:hypothetical protein BGZ92_001177 [Podila epicladia]
MSTSKRLEKKFFAPESLMTSFILDALEIKGASGHDKTYPWSAKSMASHIQQTNGDNDPAYCFWTFPTLPCLIPALRSRKCLLDDESRQALNDLLPQIASKSPTYYDEGWKDALDTVPKIERRTKHFHKICHKNFYISMAGAYPSSELPSLQYYQILHSRLVGSSTRDQCQR